MLGILCGLEDEGAIARNIEGAFVVCSAAHPERARLGAVALVQQGATRLLSFGFAGGLDPSLRPGDIVIGSSVVSAKGKWGCDKNWNDVLGLRLLGAKTGSVLGLDVVVEKASEKREAYERTECCITDMESHHVAQTAVRAKIPFTVVRVVIDSSNVSLPPAALVALKDDGRIDFLGIIRSIIRHPWQIPTLIRLGSHTQRASKGLREAAQRISGAGV